MITGKKIVMISSPLKMLSKALLQTIKKIKSLEVIKKKKIKSLEVFKDFLNKKKKVILHINKL